MKISSLPFAFVLSFFLFSCSGNKNESADYSSGDSDSSLSSTTVADLPQDSAKLIKTATMDLDVLNVYQSSRNISESAKDMGGMVTGHHISSSQNNSKRLAISADSVQVITSYSVEADMVVRVPSSKLEDFLQEAASTASFIHSSNFEISDRSLDYLSEELKRQSREKIIAKQLLKSNIKQKDAIELAYQKDALIDKEIERKRINANVTFSVVQLKLTQKPAVKKEIVANDDLSHYYLSFEKRLINALENGWSAFELLIIGILHLWVFIVSAIAAWYGYSYFRKRKKLVYPETV